jgi:autotransporter translocation and assembly factor TamB
MDLSGVVGFRSYHGGLPDFQTAIYRVRAHLRDLALDEALPLIHEENLGLTGSLDADGTMRGTLRQPIGNATFQLRNGYFKRIQIENFSANVASDESGVTLKDGILVLPFLSAQGSGKYGFAGRTIDGTLVLQNADLHTLAKSFGLPGKLRGQASGRFTLAGTLAHPKAVADVDATNASVYDIAFDEAKLHAQYAPGEVSIGNTTLTFAGRGGSIDVTGALPVQLHPLALGPKERPVDFSIAARAVDLSALNPLTQGFATLTGRLDAQATVNGSAGNPVGKGTATIAGASAESPFQTVPMTGADAQLSFENDTIALKRLHATLGTGSIDVRGAAHVVPAAGLRSYAGLQLWSRIGLHDAQVNVPNWVSGTLDGSLSFTRPGSVPYVAGTVNVSNSTIPSKLSNPSSLF